MSCHSNGAPLLEPPHGGHWSFCQIWFAPHPCAWVNNINTTNQTGNILNTIRLYVAQLTTHDRRKTHMTIIRHMSCNEVAPLAVSGQGDVPTLSQHSLPPQFPMVLPAQPIGLENINWKLNISISDSGFMLTNGLMTHSEIKRSLALNPIFWFPVP